MISLRPAQAFDRVWDGTTGLWSVASNWADDVVPRSSNNDVAVIGALEGTATGGVAQFTANQPAVGGTILGRDAATDGTLTHTAGTLNNTAIAGVSNGFFVVGQSGRGTYNVSGGILNALGLTMASPSAANASSITASGSPTISIQNTTGIVSLNGNLKITGPSVNFTTNRPVSLQSGNNYTAEITAATHAAIKTTSNLSLNGTLSVQFNGVTPTPGQSWNLFDFGGGLTGGFSNVAATGDLTVTGAPAAPLGTAYRLQRTTGGVNGNLLQVALQKVLVLQVNRNTGEMTITNPHGGTISIDGYTIESRTAGSLKTSYKGISGAPAGDTNWQKVGLSKNALAELKNDGTNNGTLNMLTNPNVALGNGFDKLAVASNVTGIGVSGEDLVFQYSYPNAPGGQVRGQIEYIGTKYFNDLVLRVNPNTGVAFLKNDSQRTLKVDGLSIVSSTGALDGTAFNAISGAGTTGTWVKSPSGTNSLTQTNLTGMTTLTPNQEIPLGDISSLGFASAAAQAGLSLQYILAESLTSAGAPGDYNNNGVVDAADYTLWRNAANTAGTLPNQNPAATTPNLIDAEDYTFWKQNFGATGGALPETEFDTGSVFFDATAAGGGALAGAAVPEPTAAWLLIAGLGCSLSFARRRRTDESSASQPEASFEQGTGNMVQADRGHRGASIMRSQFQSSWILAVTLVAISLMASTSHAVTGGIVLNNQNFNLPGGNKVVPFDANGNFVPGLIPGWIFSGPGTEVRFNGIDPGTQLPFIKGDSSVEPGGGFPAGSGTHLTLSTLDGTVYQTTAINVANIPATQAYRLTFSAFDAFTIDNASPPLQISDRAQFKAWMYTETGGVRTPFATGTFDLLPGTNKYTVEIVGGTPALSAAAGKPIGVEFDTTSIERNQGTEFPVAHSWVAVDNVLLQVAGTKAGDFNGDGNVDSADYTILRNNQQVATDYSAQAELTNDGFVDLDDFRAFKTIFNSSGSGSLAVGNVPEPSNLGLVALLGLSLIAVRTRFSFGIPAWSKLSALVVAVLMMITSSAHAVLYLYEPFLVGNNPAAGQYTLGPIVGQNVTNTPTQFFTGAWTQGGFPGAAPAQAVIPDSLSYLGTTSLGGAVSGVGRVGRFLTTEWDSSTTGTYYLSFQAKYGTANNPTGTGAGDGNLGFRTTEFWPSGNDMTSDTARSEVGFQGFAGDAAQQTPGAAQLRWIPSGGNGTAQFLTDVTFNNFNQTHLIVMKFTLSATPNTDSIAVFLDPTDSVEPEPATALVTGLEYTLNAMSTISFFGNDGSPATLPIFDELRVASTYSEALPALPCAGDTNPGCVIDINDYNTIAANFNRTDASGPSQGDVAGANGKIGADGRVDLRDYRLWRDHRTAGSGSLTGLSIPEPSTAVLALVSLMMFAGRGIVGRR